MEQPEPHNSSTSSSNQEAAVAAAQTRRRPLPDRTFSDDAAAASWNEAVSLVLLENEPAPCCRPAHLEQSDETVPEKETCARQISCGVPSLSPPAKDLLTGTLSSRRSSHLSTSTMGTSDGSLNNQAAPSAFIANMMHRQESLPGSYAVRGGSSFHSSDNDSQWSDEDDNDDELVPHHTIDKPTVEDIAPETSSPPIETVVTTAKLVTSASLDESERQRIYRQAVQTVTSNAVVAHIVPTDESPPQDGASYASPSSFLVPRTVKLQSRRCSLLLGLSCSLSVIGLLLGVGIPYAINSSSSVQLQPSNTTTVSAPTIHNTTTDPLLCITSGIGCRAFATTEELYQAIDDVDEVISYYADHPDNQTMLLQPAPVAILYGYPMGRWNLSLITNFTRVFDPWRHLPFDPNRANDPERENTTRRIATFFNEDLSGWDVSNAETMFGMFAGASSFQGRGLENWDTSRVVNLSYVFMDAISFTGRISHWNTASAVTMEGMFQGARPFDGDVSAWNVSHVTNMASMFHGNYAFRGENLHQWNVSNVNTMHSMFMDATTFKGDSLWAWDVTSVRDFGRAFSGCSSMDADLSAWNTSNAILMDAMFLDAISFAGDLSQWDTSRVEDMSYMVRGLMLRSISSNVLSSNLNWSSSSMPCLTVFNGGVIQQ
jgi:surface protein